MSGLFCTDHRLCALEKQMQQPPGYRPRGQGIYLIGEVAWESRGNYSEIVDCVISSMQMAQLGERIEEIFERTGKELIFRDKMHRKNFHTLLVTKRGNDHAPPGYAAAVFLLSVDQELWDKVQGSVLCTGIYFDRIRLGSVTLEQYILFHAAKDVYSGTKHIRLSELTDRELIPDEILRLIVNAFVIEKCGVKILEQEVVDED